MALMQGLLGPDFIAALAARVLDRTDGVPLFVEEVTRALLQRGTDSSLGLAVDRTIPASLEESLIARRDRSGPSKEVAQIASVIGRSVRRDVLSAVSRMPERRISEALAHLVQLGIFDRPRGAPVETYSFHHALLQDAAYASLLRDRRRELHGRVAEALQRFDAEGVALYGECSAAPFGGWSRRGGDAVLDASSPAQP